MELTYDTPSKSVLSEKPRSSRVKRSHFEKWKDFDVEFHNSSKFRNRKRAPLIRDSDEQLDDLSERKRSKKSVSLSDDSLGLKFSDESQNQEKEKPLLLNYDYAIPKRPRCISKQKKINTFTNNNILPYKKRKQEEFNFSEEGKIVNSHINDPQNSRFLRPKRQFENEFAKKRRRFYEVSLKDVDPFWIVKQKIRVFWPLDKSWYFGTVKEYNSKSKRHYIKYDDHEEEWVDLQKERFKLLLYPNEVSTGEANGEGSELERKMENDPIVSWISCKSRKGNNNDNIFPQNNSTEKKNFNFVYFRKRFHNEGEKLVKLEFYIPIKGMIFHFWLNRLPLFVSHGKNKIVRVSQTVQLEMVLIDNLLGLRIFNFEGYLNQAIDILCFLVSRFCPKKIIRKNTGAEMKMKNKFPCASIGVKISTTLHDDKKREMYFLTYRFHELGSLRYGLVEKYLRTKNCLKMKDLSVKNLTRFNARKISSAKDLLWPSLCKGLCEDLIHQNGNICKLDPETVYIYQKTMNRSFHPSLFLNKHLKFLIDKNTLETPVHKKPNSISSWDKSDRNSISPTSVLSNDQNTPRSKKPRTLVSYAPLKETHNSNSNSGNKTHYRKKHSWKQLNINNTTELPQAYAKTAQVKTIPTPGAHLMRGPSQDSVRFERPVKYHKEVGTEIERCMDPVHVVYDMDSDDEKWVEEYNNNDGLNKLNNDIFERVVDSFEKFAYAKKGDELSLSELEELDCFGGGFNVIHDVYEYWIAKRRERNNLPLVRQFQPPLWEVYQKQVRDWQLSFSRLRASSAENPSNQKPPLFAFCLKPKGLLNNSNNNNIKDSKQKSHKKILTSGHHFPSLDSALTAFAKRSNEASFSPRTPRDGSRTGGGTGLGDGRIRHHLHHGVNIVKSKWSCPVGSELEEFRSRDASCAAIHAANLARLKREKALVLLQKAELAMYKASCAVLIADCVKKSQKD